MHVCAHRRARVCARVPMDVLVCAGRRWALVQHGARRAVTEGKLDTRKRLEVESPLKEGRKKKRKGSGRKISFNFCHFKALS